MIVTFYGENCFKIQAGDLSIITDPFDNQIGLTPPRFKYDAIIRTLTKFPQPENDSNAINIFGPGEYNFKETNVNGFLSENETGEKFLKTIYTAEIEKIKFAFLGHLSEMPNPSVMEHLEEIDILIFPAGGKPFVDQKAATKLIRQIQPKIAIPALYKVPGLKRQADDLKVFLEEFNHGKSESTDKLTIKKKDLTGIKPTQITILQI